MARIGANIDDLLDQEAKGQDTAAAATEYHEEAARMTADFQDDVNTMAEEARGHLETFAEMVKDASTRLKAKVEATDWEGRAADAKIDRIADIDQQVAKFETEMVSGADEFRQFLSNRIDEFYNSIANDVGAVIGQMNEAWESESTHVAATAQALEDLDTQSAGLG